MKNAFSQLRNQILAPLMVLVMAISCAAETRYDDVIYLADWKQPPLQLKVRHRTPLTSTRAPKSMVAYLTEGQTVEVLGLGESQDYVKTSIATGSVQGWVDAGALELPPADLVARLHDRREKTEAHRDLIEHHEVVVGMTSAEVRASLGKPDRITRERGQQGDDEQWQYITYQHVPHYAQRSDVNGQWKQVVSYQRVRSGQKVVTFRKGEVVEIAGDSTNRPSPPIVAPMPAVH